MITALIFDFDGLIIDTETPAFASRQMIYAGYGLELALERRQHALGSNRSFDAVAHLVTLLEQGPTPERAHTLDHAEVRARRQQLKQRLSADQPLLPGVLTKLDEARAMGLPCAVASSSGRDWVAGWLRRHAIYERFVCVRTGDDVAATRPAPDLFLSAAAGLERSPEQCMVFEGLPNGILAARAAGMRVVAVPGAISRHFDLPPADLVLPALDALPLDALLQKL
jgi:HAD superfamily hydrolase (TIGR01509 family)